MLTRNWYNQFASGHAETVISKGLTDTTGAKWDSGWYSTSNGSIFIIPTAVRLNQKYNGLVFGTGTTPPTIDDYTLESPIKSGLTGSVTVSLDDKFNRLATITLTNSSEADITIAEVGIVESCWNSRNSGSYKNCLMERTLLDSPITIPAGGTGEVILKTGFDVPTA